ARRTRLLSGPEAAGLDIDGSQAGLYLWARPAGAPQNCWTTVADLAALGILAAPGAFYGAAAAGHVRLALTAPDERIAEAAARLGGS
ncbi:MAG: succinyldiaminopimelate transaminase, partial [Cellulomonas sp.]|nr:succinyldiaminopimelate transaminase [Cellulomonas sp.]